MYSSWTRVHIFKVSDSDLNPEDSDSAHYMAYDMLSHITSCIETVCLRKFSGRLVSFFLTPMISVPTASMSVFMAGYCVHSHWLCQGYIVSQTDTEVTD